MRGATVESTIRVAEDLARAPLPQSLRGELAGPLGVLAGVRLPLDEILPALRRRQVLEELTEEAGWAEYWRCEGHRRGVQEGRPDRERRVLMLALEGPFGALGDDVASACAGVDESSIRDLAENVSRYSLAEIRPRLGLE